MINITLAFPQDIEIVATPTENYPLEQVVMLGNIKQNANSPNKWSSPISNSLRYVSSNSRPSSTIPSDRKPMGTQRLGDILSPKELMSMRSKQVSNRFKFSY